MNPALQDYFIIKNSKTVRRAHWIVLTDAETQQVTVINVLMGRIMTLSQTLVFLNALDQGGIL